MTRDISEVSSSQSVEGHLEKLSRLVPTEVTAAFLAINTVIGTTNTTVNLYLSVTSAVILAALSPFLLRRFSGVTNKFQLITTPLTFLIWASNIAIYRFDQGWSPDKVLPTILILWTVALLFGATRRS